MSVPFFRPPSSIISGIVVSGMYMEVLYALKKVTDAGPVKVQQLAKCLHDKYTVEKLCTCLETLVKWKLVEVDRSHETVRGYVTRVVRYEPSLKARESIF